MVSGVPGDSVVSVGPGETVVSGVPGESLGLDDSYEKLERIERDIDYQVCIFLELCEPKIETLIFLFLMLLGV